MLLGGVQVVLVGLLGFAAKTWLSKALQTHKAELEASLERGLHMQKARFDVEFGIYREFWPLLEELERSAFAVQRARNGKGSTQQTDAFEKACEDVIRFSHRNRPFFAADVAQRVYELVTFVQEETKAGPIKSGIGKIKRARAIIAKSNEIGEEIRKRLTGT